MTDGLITFLKTKRPTAELKVALAVLQEFKACESENDWMRPFDLWVRLEQLEDYLKLLTDTDASTVEDKTAVDYFRQLTGN